MYDYIRALHAGACREPELRSTRVELDRAHRVIKGKSDQQNQEILLQLADLENELREETSLTWGSPGKSSPSDNCGRKLWLFLFLWYVVLLMRAHRLHACE